MSLKMWKTQEMDVPDRYGLDYFNLCDLDLASGFSMSMRSRWQRYDSLPHWQSHFTSTSRHELDGLLSLSKSKF